MQADHRDEVAAEDKRDLGLAITGNELPEHDESGEVGGLDFGLRELDQSLCRDELLVTVEEILYQVAITGGKAVLERPTEVGERFLLLRVEHLEDDRDVLLEVLLLGELGSREVADQPCKVISCFSCKIIPIIS